jgi:hypothetical protein
VLLRMTSYTAMRRCLGGSVLMEVALLAALLLARFFLLLGQVCQPSEASLCRQRCSGSSTHAVESPLGTCWGDFHCWHATYGNVC